MKAPKTYPFVIIHWKDIFESGGWNGAKDLKETTTLDVWSSGWIVRQDKKEIVIASCIAPGNKSEPLGVLKAIPRGCIEVVMRVKA